MTKHEIFGKDCNDPDCWCKKTFKPEEFKWKPEFWQQRDDSTPNYGFYEDEVNNPEHYILDGLEVEALDVIEASLTREEYIGYLRGNILKYNMRKNKKNGEQDMLKACFYSERLQYILERTEE